MVRVLEERAFPVSTLRLFATARSAGTRIPFRGSEVVVEEFAPEAIAPGSVAIALMSAGGDTSKRVARAVAERGAVVIDNSSAWRMDDDVPLVIPEINGDDVQAHHGIIAVPNCSTIGMLMALAPLHRAWGLRRIVVATYQSVSGKGQAGIADLQAQEADAGAAPRAFHRRIRHNVIPLIDSPMPDGSTREEWKMVHETRKILHDPAIGVVATCVRVPVPVGHGEAIVAEFEREPDPDDARRLCAAFPGVRVMDDVASSVVPLPEDAAGDDTVLVGRIRRDESAPRSLALWCVSDNLRKGAATNAVQIAETLVAHQAAARR